MADFSNILIPEGNIFDLTDPGLPKMAPLAPAPSWGGDIKAVGMAPVKTAVDVAGAATIIAGGLVGAFEYPGDHAASDLFFKAYDNYFEPAKKYLTPDPESVSWAGQIAGGVTGLAPYFALGPLAVPAMIGTATIGTGIEMTNQGVAPTTATGLGVLAGGVTAAMAEIPMLGKTYAQKAIAGGLSFAGMSMAGEAIQKKALQMSGYEDLATGINPYDLRTRSIDMTMGMFFGGMTHYMEARGKLPIQAEDAIDVVAKEQNTAKSNPFEQGSIDTHKAALDKAAEDLAAGRPVDVADIVKDAPLKADTGGAPALSPELDGLARKMASGAVDFTDAEVKLYTDNAKAIEARTQEIMTAEGNVAFKGLETDMSQHGVTADTTPEVPSPSERLATAPEPSAIPEVSATEQPVYGTVERMRGEQSLNAQLDAEFQRHMERHGDTQIQIGTDANGEPVKVSAKDAVDTAKAEIDKTSLMDTLVKAAEDCFIDGEEIPF